MVCLYLYYLWKGGKAQSIDAYQKKMLALTCQGRIVEQLELGRNHSMGALGSYVDVFDEIYGCFPLQFRYGGGGWRGCQKKGSVGEVDCKESARRCAFFICMIH
jgi:hypothetical protein